MHSRDEATHARLIFVDINGQDFGNRFPDIDPLAANRVLHARYADGTMIYGLDVTHQACRAVGKKLWLGVLRWPVVRIITDVDYRFFARYRYSISYLLTGQRRCEMCVLSAEDSLGDSKKAD
jgi:predicted DCC family thiol-disulfide oxidoreductase YuxK